VFLAGLAGTSGRAQATAARLAGRAPGAGDQPGAVVSRHLRARLCSRQRGSGRNFDDRFNCGYFVAVSRTRFRRSGSPAQPNI
jgi:hypothetical protein